MSLHLLSCFTLALTNTNLSSIKGPIEIDAYIICNQDFYIKAMQTKCKQVIYRKKDMFRFYLHGYDKHAISVLMVGVLTPCLK